MRKFAILIFLAFVFSPAVRLSAGDSQSDNLTRNFMSPPDSARPWTYWMWLNGNVTREGITRDLEEKKRQGIGGVVIFQTGDSHTPVGAQFYSSAWHELFRHALREADRLGMVVGINLCDGWNSGGPWITQDQANKKLVYSELQVDGPTHVNRLLPLPPIVDNYYHDVAVLAIPEKPAHPVVPTAVTASSTLPGYVGEWNFYPQDAVDGDPETYWSSDNVAIDPEHTAWLDFEEADPISTAGIQVVPGPRSGPRECELQSSEDGKTYSTVVRFTMEKGQPKRLGFEAIRVRHFRLLITSSYGSPVQVAEVALLPDGDEPVLRRGIKWWWFKSGNRAFWDYPRQGPAALEEEYPEDGAVDCATKDVVDLSARMDADGRLRADLPAGRWSILRFGYTLEGQQIRGTSVNSQRGYEADLLDRSGIESHFAHTALPALADARGTGTHSLQYLHIDSYELGANVRGQQPNWSAAFREEFKKHRGYDLLPYLPVLARRIVDSREVSDRFLFDFRWTIGDLMAEKFWIPYGELAHARGMKIESETGYGSYPFPHIDGLRTAGNNDIPMGEFWFGTDIMSKFNHWGNVIRTEATAAHIYGRPVVQAESFTAWTHWQEYPESLKPVGDQAFLDGLNRIVFHQYTAQPQLDFKPGWQYGAGTHFDRNLTWWEEARGFFQYLARCQYLLQSGHFDADALYFYGEGVTKFVPSPEYLRPTLPKGYNFDAIDAELLLHGLKVENGRWVLPSGMSYRVLVMPEDGVISPAALAKIRDLVAQGGVLVGQRPRRAPGLDGYPASDVQLAKIADEMWGAVESVNAKIRTLGKGKVFQADSLAEVFTPERIAPDFTCRGSADVGFLHRTTNESDVYFLSNRHDRDETADCTFRVAGKQPEIFNPVTGESIQAAAFRQSDGLTTVPLDFAPNGSLFVVFRKSITADAQGQGSRNFPVYKSAEALSGPWIVGFDPKWGGPTSVQFDMLESWTARAEDGIKYYSGTATYRKSFDLPPSLRGAHVALDLGEVKYVAQVRLNGTDLGPLWTEPFRVDITSAVKATGNVLEIDVANLWPNRIIGDSRLPPERHFTHTNIVYTRDTPLWESGLLGPVRLEAIEGGTEH